MLHSPHDAEVAHDLEGGRAQHVVLLVGEICLANNDDDRVPRVCVDPERVEVKLSMLHTVMQLLVVRVPHDLGPCGPCP